ncbi:MAG: hypothetical protein ACREMA_12125, partial [Longimicrobiales bacterium]
RTMMEEPVRTVLNIAQHALMGEIAVRGNRLAEAEQHFRAAMKLEDGMIYIEPPDWHYPIRHSLGLVLLKQGKAAAAERTYLEDLRRFPENGWSLYGLAASLRAQGKNAEAARVDARFRKSWSNADLKLTASRF